MLNRQCDERSTATSRCQQNESDKSARLNPPPPPPPPAKPARKERTRQKAAPSKISRKFDRGLTLHRNTSRPKNQKTKTPDKKKNRIKKNETASQQKDRHDKHSPHDDKIPGEAKWSVNTLHTRVRLTKKAEPPPTCDVNRDSGTASANGGWLRRLVRPHCHKSTIDTCHKNTLPPLPSYCLCHKKGCDTNNLFRLCLIQFGQRIAVHSAIFKIKNRPKILRLFW